VNRSALWPLLATTLIALAPPACTPAPCCTVDADCLGEGVCAFGRCTVPCADDADCLPGDVCARPEDGRGDRGFCRSLIVDGECAALEGSPRPDAGPPPVDDAGPPPPPADAGPPPGCVPDLHEPNNSAAQSTTDYEVGDALSICDLDQDFFRISADPGQQILARIFFTHDDGDLEIELVNPQGTVFAASTSGSDDESIVFTTDDGGRFDLRVFGATPRTENRYTLLIELRDPPPPEDGGPPPEEDAGPPDDGGPPPLCLDDNFENNDALVEARAVTFPVTGITCPNDQEDWFQVPVPSDGQVRVQLASPDHDIALFRLNGAEIAQGTPNDAGEVIDVNVGAGDLRLRVTTASDARRAYTLRVAHTPGCTDAFEPNDSRAAATLTFPQPANATICEADEDFFSVDATAGERVRARITFDNAAGDIDMELLDPSGATIGLSQSLNDFEELVRVAQQSGRYTLRVFGFGGDTGDYRLEELVASSDICLDDDLEENDDRADAELINTAPFDAVLCPDDPDFYSFVARDGDAISVQLSGPANVALTLRVLRPGVGVVAETTITGLGLLIVESDREGPVFVEVTGAPPSAGAAYSFELTLSNPNVCTDDPLEDNDAFAEQVSLPLGDTNAVLCAGDPDFYLVQPTGTFLFVELTTPGLAASATVVHVPPPPGQPELFGFVQANAGPSGFDTSGRAVSIIVGAQNDTPYTLHTE
jgi:hypothetical protein